MADKTHKEAALPASTMSPVQPIVATVASDAGAHEPVFDPHMGADGRWYARVADAHEAGTGYLTEEERDKRYGKVTA